MHISLNKDLRALDIQQQESHDTQSVQKDDYNRHHTTLDTGKHMPHPTYSTARHLIVNSYAIAALVATINTPHYTEYIHTIYDRWPLTLPPNPVFTKSNLPTDICCNEALLRKVNTSAIRMIRQITQRHLHTIIKYRTDIINYDININRLRNVCQAARLLRLSAPQLYIATTTKQNSGENPLTTRSMTIPQQIQATTDTYDRQMVPQPSNTLFYGTIMHDATGTVGVTMHPQRHFIETHLVEYHPLYSMCDRNIKQRVVKTRRQPMHLFQPVPTHSTLYGLWQLKYATYTYEPILKLLP